MLRITSLSLLLGAAALVAVLRLVYLPSGDGTGIPAGLAWNDTTNTNSAANTTPEPSPQTPRAGSTNSSATTPTQLKLNQYGWGIVGFAHSGFSAQGYSHLHIALEGSDHNTQVALAWESSESPQEQRKYSLESASLESIWISTAELRGWSGNISNFQIFIIGEPEASIGIVDFSLAFPGTAPQLRALYSDLAGFVSWNRSSMNSHSGATKVSSFYPTLLFAGFLALSLGAYCVLLLLRRSNHMNWKNIGMIFLAVWIVLDLFWQKRLTDQVADTRTSFAGKTTKEKLAVGPDALLFNFISSARPYFEHENSRVFVASSDDYTGLRGAYYLYPRNVFWTLHGEEIPRNPFLRSGDYIILLNPYTVAYDRAKGTLMAPRGELEVETLLANRTGKLVRVN